MRKLSLAIVILILTLLVFEVSCVGKDYQATETYYETEYKTEYKTESYTTTEDFVTDNPGEDTLVPDMQWSDDRLPRGTIVEIPGSFMYMGYELPKHEVSRLEFTFYTPVKCVFDAYDVSQVGHIEKFGLSQGSRGITINPAYIQWISKVNSQLAAAKHISHAEGFSGRNGMFAVDVTGVTKLAIIVASYDAVGKALESWVEIDAKLNWVDKVIETRTVTKEQQVPYQVSYQVEKQRVVTKTKKVPIWELIFGGE